MTCFWDALRSSLSSEDYALLNTRQVHTHQEFIHMLKRRSKPTHSICWQGSKLRTNEMEEHMKAIESYNVANIKNGHLTSTCDSFLLLVCELFQLNIIHIFSGTRIQYTCPNPRKTLMFKSNGGHFTRS